MKMIIDIDSDCQVLVASSNRASIVAREGYSNLEQQAGNEYGLGLSRRGDLVIGASNIEDLPSATNLELQEIEEDLLIAQKSHLEYLSGAGRPFEEFLADLHHEEGNGEVSS